jgi:S-adenosylmethionine:tRNA ribosyltransferase-isomerase
MSLQEFSGLQSLKVSDYQYHLPDEQIARFPLAERDQSRLLHYNRGDIAHHTFFQLAGLLPENCALVFNDTKVLPARLHLQRDSGSWIELLIFKHEPGEQAGTMRCTGMIGNKKKWREAEVLRLQHPDFLLSVSWINREEDQFLISWGVPALSFPEVLYRVGEMPIPPYLNRSATESDKADYQTVYARELGAVAAPTAGLHFTEKVLAELEAKGFGQIRLTLHVGLGTFKPMKTEQVADHEMHPEEVFISRKAIQQLLGNAGFLVAVGTTSMRSLESLYWLGILLLRTGQLTDFLETEVPYRYAEAGESAEDVLTALLSFMEEKQLDSIRFDTRLYIMPGYRFRMVKGIITNFHQPQSTLLVLISAFVGEDWKNIYETALAENYRFLSYGDSSLLIP